MNAYHFQCRSRRTSKEIFRRMFYPSNSILVTHCLVCRCIFPKRTYFYLTLWKKRIFCQCFLSDGAKIPCTFLLLIVEAFLFWFFSCVLQFLQRAASLTPYRKYLCKAVKLVTWRCVVRPPHWARLLTREDMRTDYQRALYFALHKHASLCYLIHRLIWSAPCASKVI